MKNQKIIKICEEKFIYLNYSPKTKQNYLAHIKSFLNNLGDKQIIHCNSNDFQSYLNNYQFTSTSQQNQIINFKRPKTEKKLPKVIDGETIKYKVNLPI